MKMKILLSMVAISMIAVGFMSTTAQTPPERALIDDLVLANRVLASRDIGVLDGFGHVSVRSLTNPNRFYISRYVSPGIVTAADIIQNDLDSKPVAGERNDQYQERFLHGEIYKTRPDVMAVVHSHTPELVAFGVSSVRLKSGDNDVPIYDIRRDNGGRSGILDTPALGKAMAQALGRSDAVLLLGHGVVVTGSSAYDVVSGAIGLRTSAQLQQQLISMGGTWDSNPRRVAANAPPAPPQPPAPVVPPGSGGGAGGDRAWEYWKWLFSPQISGPNAIPRPDTRRPGTPVEETINNLVLANRFLASSELDILGTSGHVSVRHPTNPNRYFVTRFISAGRTIASDIIENDLDSKPVAGPRSDEYQEVYIHGEIFKARPDVMAVLHSHTPEFVAFANSSIPLRPVVNGGVFIGSGLAIHDIRKFSPRDSLIRTPELGRGLAETLGNKAGALLKGHGIALTGSSLQDLVSRAYNLRQNARIQQQAIALGGTITYLDNQPPAPAAPAAAPAADGEYNRAWEYWKQIIPVWMP